MHAVVEVGCQLTVRVRRCSTHPRSWELLGQARADAGGSFAHVAAEERRVGKVLCWDIQRTRHASLLAAAHELRASRVGWGDVPLLGQGAGHPRITQRRHVGALEPKLHSLGVAG